MATAKPQENKQGDEDLSMEEILQSIRRIIAEDEGDGNAKPAAAPANGNAAAPAANANAPTSDVLELTEMVKEDGSVVSLKPDAAKAEAKAEAKPEAKPAAPEGDVLNKIDQALAPQPAAPVAAPAPAPAAATKPAAGGLISPEAASAATGALNKLKSIEEQVPPLVTSPSPAFGSGNTVENMVAAMLKPLLKEWLDANLPAIVERIVEQEVKRLTK